MPDNRKPACQMCGRTSAPEDTADWFWNYYRRIAGQSRLPDTDCHIQHGDTSCLLHSVAVAYYSWRTALFFRLPIRRKELVRGALLHDYFLYDWHTPDPTHRLHGFTHPETALKNAERDFTLSAAERDIIKNHMFPLTMHPPRCREAWLVCLVDKACSLNETLRRGIYPKLRVRLSHFTVSCVKKEDARRRQFAVSTGTEKPSEDKKTPLDPAG